jgi:hypothetical protein
MDQTDIGSPEAIAEMRKRHLRLGLEMQRIGHE